MYNKNMVRQFTALYKKIGKQYIGWIEEIPGANSQGRTIKEVKENLKEAILLVLEANKIVNEEIKGKVIREPLSICLE